MENSGNYYVIRHLVLFTGLTDRTIRNYIAAGILKGEKINGLWHFTPEEVDRFIRDPAVRPSIQAKATGIVTDFLTDDAKTTSQACMIMDIPKTDRRNAAEFFCYRISSGKYQNIQFSFDGVSDPHRVILKGSTKDVIQLVNEFSESEKEPL